MSKTRIQIFLSSFVLVFFLLYSLFQWLGQKQARLYQDEIKILHEEVENHFKLLVENNQSILLVASTLLTNGNDFSKSYADLTRDILKNFDEIMGMNFVNAEGVITRVSPMEKNEKALGKTTQNYKSLLIALERGEKLFISPPFDLYQGVRGIGFYIPVFQDIKLVGWLAIAQGLDRFMEKFVNSKFLGAYHLIIRDVETSRNYYSSSELPNENVELAKHKVSIKGREIEFFSWRKASLKENYFSWITVILCSTIVALFLTLTYLAVEQRGRAKKELENIEVLLRATFNSTSSNLNLIQEQMELVRKGSGFVPLKKISNHLIYLTTLIDQLRVLVKISESKELERTSMLPMIVELSNIFNSKLQLKDIHLIYDAQEFFEVDLLTAQWSICHNVLECLIDYFVEISEKGTEIKISVCKESTSKIIVSNVSRHHSAEIITREILPENLIQANISIQSLHGELLFENKESGAVAIISLPGMLKLKETNVS